MTCASVCLTLDLAMFTLKVHGLKIQGLVLSFSLNKHVAHGPDFSGLQNVTFDHMRSLTCQSQVGHAMLSLGPLLPAIFALSSHDIVLR